MAKKEVTSPKAASSASKTLQSGAAGPKAKAAAGGAPSQTKASKNETQAKTATAASKTLKAPGKSAAGSTPALKPAAAKKGKK